jgi:hypothetical protein
MKLSTFTKETDSRRVMKYWKTVGDVTFIIQKTWFPVEALHGYSLTYGSNVSYLEERPWIVGGDFIMYSLGGGIGEPLRDIARIIKQNT